MAEKDTIYAPKGDSEGQPLNLDQIIEDVKKEEGIVSEKSKAKKERFAEIVKGYLSAKKEKEGAAAAYKKSQQEQAAYRRDFMEKYINENPKALVRGTEKEERHFDLLETIEKINTQGKRYDLNKAGKWQHKTGAKKQ